MRVCPKCKSTYTGRLQFCAIDGEKLRESKQDPLIGETVGKYEIVEALGRGGTGCVYRAVHKELETEFALKVLLGNLGGDETLVGRFKREAQAASKIHSRNVVRVIDFGTTDAGLSYLVMEYVSGRSLDNVITKNAPLPVREAAKYALDTARGLASAHALGFVHRDVKPGNVFIVPEPGEMVAKLLDFGIVRIDAAEDVTRLTSEGKLIGTPSYMAPEQWEDAQVGPQADLYALGVMLFEMLAGKKPFKASTLTEAMTAHVSIPPPELPHLGDLTELVSDLLKKEPQARPNSANTVVARLEAVLPSLSDNPLPVEHIPEASSVNISSSGTMERPMSSVTQARTQNLSSPTSTIGKGPIIAVAAIGIVVVGLAGAFVGRSTQPTNEAPPDVGVVVSLEPIIEDARAQIDKALADNGLDRSEVDPAAIRAFESALTNGKEAKTIEAALAALKDRIAKTELTDDQLRGKLDGMDSQLAMLREKLEKPEAERMESRYLGLYKMVGDPAVPKRDLTKLIAEFERDLRRVLK